MVARYAAVRGRTRTWGAAEQWDDIEVAARLLGAWDLEEPMIAADDMKQLQEAARWVEAYCRKLKRQLDAAYESKPGDAPFERVEN